MKSLNNTNNNEVVEVIGNGNEPVYADKKVSDNAGGVIKVTKKASSANGSASVSTDNNNNNNNGGNGMEVVKKDNVEEVVEFDSNEVVEQALSNVAEGQDIEVFNLVGMDELDADELVYEGADIETVEEIEGQVFKKKKGQVIKYSKIKERLSYFLGDKEGNKLTDKGYPTIGKLLTAFDLHKESKIVELDSNTKDFKVVVIEEKEVHNKVKYTYKAKGKGGKKVNKTHVFNKLEKKYVNRMVLDYDTMMKFVEFNKTKVISMPNITVTTVMNAYREFNKLNAERKTQGLEALNVMDIKDEEALRKLGLKDYTNDIEMANLYLKNNIERVVETSVKTLATSGSTRNVYEQVKLGKFNDTELICFSMTSDSATPVKVKAVDENKDTVKDEYGNVVEEWSLELVAPKLDENGKPVVTKNGKVATQIAVPATDLYDFLDVLTYKGRKLNFVIQSSSQDRLGSGFYAVATNSETDLEDFLNVYSNGFYGEMKGKEVAKKEIKRIAQDSSSSKVLITEEQYEDLNTVIIPNKTLLIKTKVIDVVKDELVVVERIIERMIGDGQGAANGKVMALGALNAGDINLTQYNRLKLVGFDLANPSVAGIIKKVKLSHQVRAAKGLLVYTDSKEMNRLVKANFTKEELAKYNGGVEPDFSKDFDIVYSQSMIKGGIEVDKLSTIGHSKSSLEADAKWSKLNPSFLMSYGATTKASQVADLVTNVLRDKLIEIKNGHSELSKAYNIQSDSRAMDHKASALQILALPNDPTLLLRQASQEIENLVKKGISIELPKIQYNFIIDDTYAMLSKCNEWTVQPQIEEVDEVDGEKVFKIKGDVITRRGGKVTVLRNPHNGFNSIVCRESLKASDVLTDNKAWMTILFNQNITMLSPDEIVYYLDGADFDGDKVMLIYAQDYPCFYVEKSDFHNVCQKYLYPIYVENGIGQVTRAKGMEFNIANIHNAIKKSIAIKNNVGLISERVTTLNELRDIMLMNGAEIRRNEKGLSEEEVKKAILRAATELKKVIELSVLGNAYNQAEIDKNLQFEKFKTFFDTTSKKVSFNGETIDVVGLEYRGKTANGVFPIEMCQSVPAVIYKRVEGLVQEVSIQLVEAFENAVNKIKRGDATIFGKSMEECGLDTDRFADIKTIDKKNDKFISIYRSLDAQYNMELHDLMEYIEDVTKGDRDSYSKMIKEETAKLSDKYISALKDMTKDRDLAYAGIIYILDKAERKIDNKLNADNLLDERAIARLMEYKPVKGKRLPGAYGIGFDEDTEEPVFAYVDGLKMMRALTSGTSFLYNVMYPGLINLMPEIELCVPENTTDVLVRDNQMFLVKDNSFSAFKSKMNFLKKVDGDSGEEYINLVDLRTDTYPVQDGKVKIAKLISESNGFVYSADKTVIEGNYNAEVIVDGYDVSVAFRKQGSKTVEFMATGVLVNTLAKELRFDFVKKNGLYPVYVSSNGGTDFIMSETKEDLTERVEESTNKAKSRANEIKEGLNNYKAKFEEAINEDSMDDEDVMAEYENIFANCGVQNQSLVNAITEEDSDDLSELVEKEMMLGEYQEANSNNESIVVSKKSSVATGIKAVSDEDLYNSFAHVLEVHANLSAEQMEGDMAHYQTVLANRNTVEYMSDNFKTAVQGFKAELVDAGIEITMKGAYTLVEDIMAELVARNNFNISYDESNAFGSVLSLANALELM